jgi:hypothetical protein
MFADAIPRLHALQARPVDFFKHSAQLRRQRELLFIRLVDALECEEDEYECGTDILRDVLYRRRTRHAEGCSRGLRGIIEKTKTGTCQLATQRGSGSGM